MGRGTGSEPAAAGKLENQGALTIKVVALRGLSRSSLTDTLDPYVELCLDGQSMTTPAVNNTGGNSEYDVSLGPFVRKLNSDSLVVRVWDSDADMLGRIKSKPDENVVAECEIGTDAACSANWRALEAEGGPQKSRTSAQDGHIR